MYVDIPHAFTNPWLGPHTLAALKGKKFNLKWTSPYHHADGKASSVHKSGASKHSFNWSRWTLNINWKVPKQPSCAIGVLDCSFRLTGSSFSGSQGFAVHSRMFLGLWNISLLEHGVAFWLNDNKPALDPPPLLKAESAAIITWLWSLSLYTTATDTSSFYAKAWNSIRIHSYKQNWDRLCFKETCLFQHWRQVQNRLFWTFATAIDVKWVTHRRHHKGSKQLMLQTPHWQQLVSHVFPLHTQPEAHLLQPAGQHEQQPAMINSDNSSQLIWGGKISRKWWS